MRAEQRNVAQRERERERVRARERDVVVEVLQKETKSATAASDLLFSFYLHSAGLFRSCNFLFLPLFFFYFFFLLKKYYSFYYLWCEIYGVKLMVPAYFWHQLKGHFRGVSEAYPIKIAS